MSPYGHLSYARFIEDFVRAARSPGPALTFASVARQAGVQKSYFAAMLKGRWHLSADQLFLVGRARDLGQEEIDYLLLLLEIERCGGPARRDRLVHERHRLRKEKSKAEAALRR